MMAKSRDERYSDVHALDRDLYRLQIGEPVEADGASLSAIATFVDPRAPTKPLPSAAAPSAAPAFVAPTPAPTAPAPDSRAHTPVGNTPAPTSQAPAPAFREEDLHFVEVELAKRIGPLARVLIKKAARTAPNLVALGAAVADQIADEEERRSFRNAVRARAN